MARQSAYLTIIVLALAISFSLASSASLSPLTGPPVVTGHDYGILSGQHTVIGEQRALIVLVEFQDVRHSKSLGDMKKVALDQLNSYYTEVSYGKASIAGQLFGWYKLNQSMGYYGHDDETPGDDANLRSLAVDAFGLLSSSVDLDSFKFLVVVHAGKDQAYDKGKVLSDEIWSKAYCPTFPDYGHASPVTIRSKSFACYAFLSEFDGLGTFAHEWGHLFGLPDLYDHSSREKYVGFWSLMDAGGQCCPSKSQLTPSYIGAWGATLVGWLSPSIPETNVVVSLFTLNPLESPEASSILIPASSSTYYFVEYRTKTGRDSNLAGSGILISFVDEQLRSGNGTVKLVNPKTGNLFPAQEDVRNLNRAVFSVTDKFRDATHQTYLAFAKPSGQRPITVIYSTQEVVTSALGTRLLVSAQSFNCSQNDRIVLNATLLDQKGAPLAGQTVEVHILDPSSRQWQIVGSSTTGQQGQISLETKVTYAAGTHEARFLYLGGKIGKDWYASAITAFKLNVAAVTIETTSTEEAILGELGNIVPALVFSAVIVVLIAAPVAYLWRRSKAKPRPRAVIADVTSVGCQQIQLGAKAETESARAEMGSVKFCIRCGEKIPRDSNFCHECGTKQVLIPVVPPKKNGEELKGTIEADAGQGTGHGGAYVRAAPKKCPSCGSEIQPTDVFCGNCRKKVAGVEGRTGARKRPTGLTIIAILWFVGGVINLYSSSNSIRVDLNALPRLSDPTLPRWFTFGVPAELLISLLVFALGLIQLYTIYGLWSGRSWSYRLALTIPILGMIGWVSLAGLYMSAPPGFGIRESAPWILVGFSVFWTIVYWVYLRRPHVKEYLGVRKPPRSPSATGGCRSQEVETCESNRNGDWYVSGRYGAITDHMASNPEAPVTSTSYRLSFGLSDIVFAENGILVVRIISSAVSKVTYVLLLVFAVVMALGTAQGSSLDVKMFLLFGTGAGLYAVRHVILMLIASAKRGAIRKLPLEDLVKARRISSRIEWAQVMNAEVRGRWLTISWNGKKMALIVGAESTNLMAFLSSKLGNRIVVKD